MVSNFFLEIGIHSTNPKLIDVLNNLHKEQVASNLLLHRILSKIETIEVMTTKTSIPNQTFLDPVFLSLFPINSHNSFHANEDRIHNELDFIPKLVIFIFIIKKV